MNKKPITPVVVGFFYFLENYFLEERTVYLSSQRKGPLSVLIAVALPQPGHPQHSNTTTIGSKRARTQPCEILIFKTLNSKNN